MDFKWYIGTSGFSFDDWIGTVYPPDIKKSEMFTYYWQYYGFNSVELNFTFYRMPSRKTILNLLRRAPAGFKFAIKLHSSITHEREITNIQEFFKSCNVIGEEGKMIGYFAQFPYSFKCTHDNLEYINKLLEHVKTERLFLEFRHVSWVEKTDLLESHNNVYIVIPDLPTISGLFHLIKAKKDIIYLRLHGRNTKWFTADEKTRYDYNYSEEELKEIIDIVFHEKFQRAYVFFNNCYRGQALKNALTFRNIVGGEKIGIFG